MKIILYNSLVRKKEEFQPNDPKKISIYVCGPTVYSAPHLGNGLSVIVFDLLYRVISYVYGRDNVVYVRNITDVDDKINQEAKQRGVTINALTKEVTEIFHENTNYLQCLSPNIEPRVTDHISEIIFIIEKLIENGFAYVSNGHVYFEVSKYEDYTKLSGRKMEDLFEGVRISVAEDKEHFADFVLWKPADLKDDESSKFESPWGLGRPGWHIECSAMSYKYLGQDFDIHGGGVDLLFPHHTNEIAQSCCAFPGSRYAKYWVHNGFLTVEGEKMSKSLKNFITISELQNQGIDGEIVRFHVLSSHYRKPMDWNNQGIKEAKKILDNFYRATEIIEEEVLSSNLPEDFIDALCDDLSTPKAYAILHEIYHNINKSEGEQKKIFARELKKCCNFIGLLNKKSSEWFAYHELDIDLVESKIALRTQAKKDRDFKMADTIRDELLAMGVILEDGQNGSTIWRKK